MSTDENAAESPSGRKRKVVRVIEKYNLDNIGQEMEKLWTTDAETRMSLRELADYFNCQVLASALADSGEQPLEGEVQNLYRLLTDDNVSEADRTRARRRLERKGIDVDQLEKNFVTYQAIRSYLKEERGAKYTPEEQDRTEIEGENIQKFRGRLRKMVDSKLEQLRANGDIVLDDFRLFTNINVLCETCGTQYEIDELLNRGGCGCQEPSSFDGK